jgi:hypothetical protein
MSSKIVSEASANVWAPNLSAAAGTGIWQRILGPTC